MLDRTDSVELVWALGEADGALGLGTNFGAAAACLELGVSVMGGGDARKATEMPERRLEAAGRERAVRRVLERMERRDVNVLRRYYCCPLRGFRLPAWGRLTPLVPMTGTVLALPGDDVLVWMVETSWAGGALAERVGEEAAEMLARAERRWTWAKYGVGR